MNPITMKAQIDPLLLAALREDISNEDVSTNAVIREETPGEVELLAKQDGVIAGLDVFARVFTLLDERTEVTSSARTETRCAAASSWAACGATSACCSPARAWR